jgi:hypothetical protein
MPTPINLDFSVLSRANTMMNQEAHLHLASPQSFTSAREPFSTICSFQYGLSSSMVQSLAVKVQVYSTPTVSCHAFTLLAFEPVTSTTEVSCHAFTLMAFEPVTSTSKVSCHTFALLAFELVTSTTNISSAKSALKALAEMQPSADISQNLGSQLIFQLIDVTISNKDEMCSASQLVANEHKGHIKSIMSFIFQLIVGSKQMHQRILKQVLVDVWSSNAISYFWPNQHESSCAYLLAAHSKCLNSHESSCASKVAHAKCLNSRESSCTSKVACAKCLNSHESSCASLLAACAKCLNSNESSCASLLAVHAKPLKSNKTQRMTPSLFLKFIGKSILEEAQFAPTTLQAFKLIVV